MAKTQRKGFLPCYVYFITDDHGHIKIGKANDIQQRLEGLQTGNPYKLRVLLTIPTRSETQAFQVEQGLHQYFSKDRMEGEWFQDKHICQFLDSNEIQKQILGQIVSKIYAQEVN